jgi:hypothetical protein
MTQGYGPNGTQNQQPQQWGQVPQPGAGSYPGAPGFSAVPGAGGSSTPRKLATWMLVLVIAVIAVRILREVVVFAAAFVSGAVTANGSADGGLAAAGIGGILAILLMIANVVVTLALLVFAIIVAVQASGRGRTGAIVVAATLIVAVVLYWIVYGIYLAFSYGAGDPSAFGPAMIVYLVLEIGRSLIVFAALIVGAMMTRRWAALTA